MPRSASPVALVTGAANGIGLAIARSLLASGWRVAVLDLPGAGLARRFVKHRRAAVIEGDVAEEATANRAVAAALERFGRIDGIVSNAGISRNKPIRRLALEDWQRVLDVNLPPRSCSPAPPRRRCAGAKARWCSLHPAER